MGYRFTLKEKFRDPWFRRLQPAEKLVYEFLQDSCDPAGFWEIDLDAMAFYTGFTRETAEAAFKAVGSKYIEANGTIWLKNYLRHQKCLPLRQTCTPHVSIIRILETRSEQFPCVKCLIPKGFMEKEEQTLCLGLPKPTGKGKGLGQGYKEGGPGETSEESIPENRKQPEMPLQAPIRGGGGHTGTSHAGLTPPDPISVPGIVPVRKGNGLPPTVSDLRSLKADLAKEREMLETRYHLGEYGREKWPKQWQRAQQLKAKEEQLQIQIEIRCGIPCNK